MPAWQPRIVEDVRMKYLGIAEALQADIGAGLIGAGDRLPPQRAIAQTLDVDLTTVTRAFNEARRRGLIDAQAGRGTFVRDGRTTAHLLTRIGESPRLDLSMNIPPQPASADLQKLIPRGIADLLGTPRGMLYLSYQESAGSEPDRHAAAAWLEDRVRDVPANRIVVAGGAQSALYAIVEVVLSAGDVIAAGEMTYPGLKAVAKQKGLTIASVAMDEGGIRPDEFERICQTAQPRALYVIPAIDNPTTATLPAERREALVAIARRHDVALIEDDPYSPLRGDRLPALAALAGDITWHVATLSKCASPALRIAYVVAPTTAQAMRLAGVLRATTMMAPPLMAALASRWIADGVLAEITEAIRVENAERQRIAAKILSEASYVADPTGHHLWLTMPHHWRAADFAEHADRLGISIVPGAAFATGHSALEAVRISLGVAPDRLALENGLRLLADLLPQPSPATRAVV